MKRTFQLLLLLLPLGVLAQEKGVYFEHGLSWKEVQAKAKAENKYIFMDCYTTWCGSCKWMAKEIFPKEEMGDFFNKHFINVSVQLDITDGDKDEIKKWYADARAIDSVYLILTFPTFLYFSPEGKLMHRVVGAGEANAFIEKSSQALNPSTQYYTLLENFKNNPHKEQAEIGKMVLKAEKVDDNNSKVIFLNEFFATVKPPFTIEDCKLIDKYTYSSQGAGFNIFLKQGDKIDEILGKGTAYDKINDIIFKEAVIPNAPQKEGAMPDWEAIQAIAVKKNPYYGEGAIAIAKLKAFYFTKDWNSFQHQIVPYLKKYGSNLSAETLNLLAKSTFALVTDRKCLEEVQKWCKLSFQDMENPRFMDTYANILYKLGDKKDAIVWEEKAAGLANGEKGYKKTLGKMKRGEKTWEN